MNAISPIPMSHRASSTSYPRGWYSVCEASDIGPDEIRAVSWLGQEMIVYRKADGKAQVADAYCPHLGAHLGSHDGALCAGKIICPFHKWSFDASTGQVLDIPYTDRMPPSSVRLALHETREVDGMILMWYSSDSRQPDAEPYASEALSTGEYTLYHEHKWESTCPFKDILENLFDTAHIQQLHRSTNIPEIVDLSTEPFGLRVTYRSGPGEEMPLESITARLSGVTLLHQEFVGTGFSTVFVHSFTPIDQERFVQKSRFFIAKMADATMSDAIGRAFLDRFVFEVDQDMRVLNYKKHLDKPRLCAGDGPIMKYRQYADRYYR